MTKETFLRKARDPTTRRNREYYRKYSPHTIVFNERDRTTPSEAYLNLWSGNRDRGKAFERRALYLYSVEHNTKLKKTPFKEDPILPFGGEPDAITEDNVLVEVKCPRVLRRDIPLSERYVVQVQVLMEIFECEESHVVQYCAKEDRIYTTVVKRDRVVMKALLTSVENTFTELEILS